MCKHCECYILSIEVDSHILWLLSHYFESVIVPSILMCYYNFLYVFYSDFSSLSNCNNYEVRFQQLDAYLHWLYILLILNLILIAPNIPCDIGKLSRWLQIPELPTLISRFLRSTGNHQLGTDKEFTGKVYLYSSTVATYFSPSDMSRIGGMLCECICSMNKWQNGHEQCDCVFVEHDEDIANAIIHAAHLIGIAGDSTILHGLLPSDTIDVFKTFYVNKFIDYHAFELAF